MFHMSRLPGRLLRRVRYWGSSLPGLAEVRRIEGRFLTPTPNTQGSLQIACAEDEVMLGAGAEGQTFPDDFFRQTTIAAYPVSVRTWRVRVRNDRNDTLTWRPVATCTKVGS